MGKRKSNDLNQDLSSFEKKISYITEQQISQRLHLPMKQVQKSLNTLEKHKLINFKTIKEKLEKKYDSRSEEIITSHTQIKKNLYFIDFKSFIDTTIYRIAKIRKKLEADSKTQSESYFVLIHIVVAENIQLKKLFATYKY
ncbi:transcription initiation factor iie alpha subunit [Anaeramoeba ignava]|uniref:Transcription initiation factor iie alpha subunit n=1 Tax=Anaeramoeba ignava TaxID=1746090 RepID=A0A9Q0LLG0_ANAIG|nr:transcription initiation factor iie alpha subunit [Anaeramoeba ignava]